MRKVEPELKLLQSPDVPDLKQFEPSGPFGILVQAIIGPGDSPGEESFDIILCTPEWFAAHTTGPVTSGRHYLFVETFNFEILEAYLRNYCSRCADTSWSLVAQKLGRLGKWEFEDYVTQ